MRKFKNQKNQMKKALFLLLSIAFCSMLQAQVVYDYLKGADRYFKNGDYYSAATYYEKFLGMKAGKMKVDAGVPPYASYKGIGKKAAVEMSSKEQAMYNLAESYRLLHFHSMAEPIYKTCLSSIDKNKFPLTRYWYASTLRYLGNYAEAEAALKQFLDEYPNDDEYKEQAAREIKNLGFIQDQMKRKDLGLYKVVKTTGEIPDSGAAVYAPYFTTNNVFYTSTVEDKTAPKLQTHNNRVYTGNYGEGKITGVSKLSLKEEKGLQQGVISIHPDTYIMYVTRWKVVKGNKLALLCRSIRKDTTWSIPDPLGPFINAEGYSSQQGFVTADGKSLIFSSNMPGGQGGFDLYVAPIDENGQVGSPVNMGADINTKGDEQAPFYHVLSKTLVFSSNGRVGMGGYDFFYCKGVIGNFAAPFNFGYPVNSPKDDIYFASRGGEKNILDDVLMSSDRNDVCCLELFSLHKERIPKEIKGKVISCDKNMPLSGVSVEIKDTINDKVIGNLVTDSTGSYSFKLDDYLPLSAHASKEGFYNGNLQFTGPADIEELNFDNSSLCLTMIPTENPIVLNNVYFDFNSAKLKSESSVDLDKIIEIMKKDTTVVFEISAHTDSKGSDTYNQKLSLSRAKSVVDYLFKKGVPFFKLKVQGYGESHPVSPNENPDGSDNPEGRAMNRRVEAKLMK